MANLFAGLENLGLNGLDSKEVFKEEEKKEDKKEEKRELTKEEKEAREEDFIFDKTYICPVCDKEFTSKNVRTGKVRLVGADDDLRPIYQDVDSLKYDAVMCPNCGYSALNRYFNFVMSGQAKAIKENISANFTYQPEEGKIYNYDDAILRHKMALACTVVKKGKNSEKAYTCLKLGWLCRGKRELLMQEDGSLKEEIAALAEEEKECLENAFTGFKEAFSKEDFPMCGMDQHTVIYLLAELAYRTGHVDDSKQYCSRVITAKDANKRIKDKARDLKEKLQSK